MDEFKKRYAQLNAAQKQAVDHIDGPILVVAGPGTGKTQLLSMRVANILRKADVTPKNILCLTFTEDAAQNMRERLTAIIGQEAYDVEIHTFHSFGASIIGRYGEYFYQGIGTKAADELSTYEIFRTIFTNLPPDNPLATQFEGEFLFLRGAQQAIDNFKTAGLAPTEVAAIAKDNQTFITEANRAIADIMEGFTRVDKTTPERFQKMLDALRQAIAAKPAQLPSFVKYLGETLTASLDKTLQQVEATGKTTAITEWKNAYLKQNAKGEWQLKETETNKKLLALADVYDQYLLALREAELFDFNDMIMRVVHAMELFDELRLNLQEQYQYILVDEFQDTSLAQLRMIQSLTNNPVFEGKPNVLAVGDDDQAIYSFQGAELSNILSFHDLYTDVKVITLTENYRSRQEVLDGAAFVIGQSTERLATSLPNLNKNIVAKNASLPAAAIVHKRFGSEDQQRQWIADDIARQINNGVSPADIAVISAKHSGLKAIAPSLAARDIPVRYDKRENILEVPQIAQLITLTKTIIAIGNNNQRAVNALLPEVISFDFWQVPTQIIWETYVANNKSGEPWLETLRKGPHQQLSDMATALIELGTHAAQTPLEAFLDQLTGATPLHIQQDAANTQLEIIPRQWESPFKNYYFDNQNGHSLSQLELLSHLRFIRDRLREFNSTEALTAKDFLRYVELCNQAGIQLVDTTPHREQQQAVSLYTAHASKGLEFGHVYIADANQEVWAASASHRGSIPMPANLPIERASGSEDERRRLLFVAMTRAKYRLIITGFEAAKRGNGPLKFLASYSGAPTPSTLVPEAIPITPDDTAAIAEQLQTSWHDRHIVAQQQPGMKDILEPVLANYKLSITHLQCFTNIVNAGPQEFFLRYILRFPQKQSGQLALGNAVHATLDAAQKHLVATGQLKEVPKLLEDFANSLHKQKVTPDEEKNLIDYGNRVLSTYLNERYSGFSAKERFEFDLSSQPVLLGSVRLAGKIDRITPLDDNTVRVTDFKTSRPLYSWDDKDPSKAIRLHFYKQQLVFYKLLLEQSKALGTNTRVGEAGIEFVIPDSDGHIADTLSFSPIDADVERLKALATVVWQKVQNLDLPDVSGYPKSLKGVLQFEDDLINS